MIRGMAIGGGIMLVLAGLAVFVPVINAFSIADLGEICDVYQEVTGLQSLLGLGGSPFVECHTVRQITIVAYAVGGVGLVLLVSGIVIRWR